MRVQGEQLKRPPSRGTGEKNALQRKNRGNAPYLGGEKIEKKSVTKKRHDAPKTGGGVVPTRCPRTLGRKDGGGKRKKPIRTESGGIRF